jgi:hypothetical protein
LELDFGPLISAWLAFFEYLELPIPSSQGGVGIFHFIAKPLFSSKLQPPMIATQ